MRQQVEKFGVRVEPVVEPFAVYPAVQQVPLVPQSTHRPVPVPGRPLPGVVVGPDGVPYYGHPPTVYPEVQRVGVDPIAQRLVGVGVCAAGVGWGVGEVVSAVAGAGSSLLMVGAVALAWKLLPSGARTVVNQRTEITHHNTATGFFGRAASSTTTHNNGR